MRNNIKALINSGITAHKVAADTGLPRNTVYRIFTKETKLDNVKFATVETLNNYYLEEMGKMTLIQKLETLIKQNEMILAENIIFEDDNGRDIIFVCDDNAEDSDTYFIHETHSAEEAYDFLEKEEYLQSIKEIISNIESGELELENSDPDYYENEYTNGATDHYIVHRVECEELEMFFAEYDHVKEIREEIYKGAKTEEYLIEHIGSLNDLEDQYDYNNVIAYRIDGGQIEWI